MSDENNFTWEDDVQPSRGGQISDSAAMREAAKQLQEEGYVVDGLAAPQAVTEEQFEENEISFEEPDSFLNKLLSEEDTDVLNTAKVRLEQARLYEMVLEHDMFSGVNSDPRAIHKVQTEIKNFIMERLEILLGMRQEKQKQQADSSTQFNDMEVAALKDLAFKLTKGATASAEPQATSAVPKQTGLKTLSQAMKTQNIAPVKQRTATTPARKPINKSIRDMTQDELLERSRQVKSGKKAMPVNQQPLPMPEDGLSYGGGAQAGQNAQGNDATSIIARALGATQFQDVGEG
jgi:hypothetical protein